MIKWIIRPKCRPSDARTAISRIGKERDDNANWEN